MVRKSRCRSWSMVVSSLAIALTCTPRGGAETLPYRAHVAQPAVELRSGPGEDHYVTDSLPQGRQIEVYQERPGGWCAIRPPEGSYSWVFARHVELLAGGLGEINKDDVASRVGGPASDQRDAVQVHLAKGEIVQVLGTDERGGETWYKIAPPSGEFRWILRSSLASDGPVQDSVVRESSDSALAADPAPGIAGRRVPAGDRPQPETAGAQPAQTDVWHAAPQEVIVASHEEAASIPANGAAQDGASPTQPATSMPVAESAASPAGPAAPPADDFTRQVADLDLRLSQVVAQPTVTWQVDQLTKEGEELLSRATSVTERDAVKPTLAKIDRFAAIYRRYQWSSAAQTAAGAAPQQPAGVAPLQSNPQTATQPQYDAVGVLRPVVSKRPSAPDYALVNDQGQVVSFVTPSPDLNLQPYLGRRVGIVGGRGYIPEFQRAHVTASRVTPLGVGDRVLR